MKMETFAGRVTILNDATKNNLHLNRCSNQVFISNNKLTNDPCSL